MEAKNSTANDFGGLWHVFGSTYNKSRKVNKRTIYPKQSSAKVGSFGIKLYALTDTHRSWNTSKSPYSL